MDTDKARLRREIKNRLALLPKEQFREAGLRAAALIRHEPVWHSAKTILLFLSAENEIDTLPLLETALEQGKKLFVPKLENDAPGLPVRIKFYRIDSSQGPWEKGPFNIREPMIRGNENLKAADFPALVFTPGLAFDMAGNRLGRGKGFYDRFLSELKKREYQSAGLCMQLQIVPFIPTEKWDHKVDFLFSESECRACGISGT